jgi:hypothetical protein
VKTNLAEGSVIELSPIADVSTRIQLSDYLDL